MLPTEALTLIAGLKGAKTQTSWSAAKRRWRFLSTCLRDPVREKQTSKLGMRAEGLMIAETGVLIARQCITIVTYPVTLRDKEVDLPVSSVFVDFARTYHFETRRVRMVNCCLSERQRWGR